MRLEAVELLDLHAELEGLARSEAVALGDAGADRGTRHPYERDAAEAVTSHLATHYEGQAAAEALHEVAARLCLRPCPDVPPPSGCDHISCNADELVSIP